MDDFNFEDFEQYLIQGEPDKKKKTYAWQTAIGLQAVDNLKPSDYLIETAKKNIEGEISIKEAQNLIKTYYETKSSRDIDDEAKAKKPSDRERRGRRSLRDNSFEKKKETNKSKKRRK